MSDNDLDSIEKKNNEIALDMLGKDISKGNVFAFIGSGCSSKLFYPGWDELLCKIEDKVLNKADIEIYKYSEKCTKDKLWYAEKLVTTIGDDKFHELIKDIFQPPRIMNSSFHRNLVNIPFRHYLTTNYDTLLEIASKGSNFPLSDFCWNDKERLNEFFQGIHEDGHQLAKYVLHLHGRFDRPDSIILTERDYMKMYFEQETFNKILWSIISSFRMCFIGFALEDLDLLSVFRKSRWDLGRGQYRHYVILDEKNDIKTRQSHRAYLNGKYGIQPIFFSRQPKIIERNKISGIKPNGSEILKQLLQDGVVTNFNSDAVCLEKSVSAIKDLLIKICGNSFNVVWDILLQAQSKEWVEQEAIIEKLAFLFSDKNAKQKISNKRTTSLKKDAARLKEITDVAKQ